ncbi:K02A2.6-like, partial [Cordylochernes scorpioides]
MLVGYLRKIGSSGIYSVDTAEDEKFQSNIKNEDRRQQILSLVDERLNEEQKSMIAECLEKYSEVIDFERKSFSTTSNVKHKIDTSDSRPIKQRPYRVSPVERRAIQTEVVKMIKMGIVQPSESPWSFPVVLVKKKDGSWRFCIDYRKLNKVTKKDVYPLPRNDDVLDSLTGAKFFSSMDLRTGYWQIEIDEEDREKTAFITPDGLYEFRVMPFGLCNAPATFERMMDKLLAGLKWTICLCYLDDIIVYATSVKEHIERLGKVFRCIQQAGLCINHEKCRFGSREIKETTGFSPFYLVHGRDVETPLDTILTYREEANRQDDHNELITHLNPYPEITRAREIARSRTQNKHKKDKETFDKQHRTPHFEVNDLVLVKNYRHPDTAKLAPYFTGQYTVIEIISPNVVRIGRPNQPLNRDSDTIHVNKLKYYTENVYTSHLHTPDLFKTHSECPQMIFQGLISTLQLVERLDRYPLRKKIKIDSVEPEETSMNVKKESTQVSNYVVQHLPRNPSIYSGEDGEDLQKWLKGYARVARYNHWDETLCLTKVYFYLSGTALKWFENNEESIQTWKEFTSQLENVFGKKENSKLQAEKKLKTRAKLKGESTEFYIQDLLCLCKEVDPQMSEEDKISHLMKGIAEELYQALLPRDVQSTEQFITECRRVEALRCRRVTPTKYERLPNVASLCDQDDREDLSSLIRKIVREEIQQALDSPQEEPKIAANEDLVREEILKTLASISEPTISPPQAPKA